MTGATNKIDVPRLNSGGGGGVPIKILAHCALLGLVFLVPALRDQRPLQPANGVIAGERIHCV